MNSILGKLGLVEDEASEVRADVAPVTVSSHTPIAQPIVMVPIYMGQTALTSEDQAHLKALSDQVFATPSTYVIFRDVRGQMGNPSNVQSVFDLLKVANPGVTPVKVLADIDTHLGIIDTKRHEFDAQVSQARASRIDGPSSEIASLTAANQDAQHQIEQRAARIAQLQSDARAAEQSVTDGVAHFKSVEDQLKAPLLQAKQLLSAITS